MNQKEDIRGFGTSSVADGSIVDHINICLRDIEIAGLHLRDVNAVVVAGQNVPLLMGQSAIQKLGPIEIDGNKLTIKNGATNSDYNKIIRKDSNGFKYIDTYLDNGLILKNLNHNAQGYVKYKRWDESRSNEFYDSLKKFIIAIQEGRLSVDFAGNLIDSKGILDNGKSNWRDENDRVITQEQYEALSKKKQRRCTNGFYPNREVARYILNIAESLYKKAIEKK